MAELIVQCDEEEFDAALFSRCGGAACEADAPLSVEVVFTDAEGIRKLNADTRGKDAVTDVLSYPNLEGIFGKKIAKAEHPSTSTTRETSSSAASSSAASGRRSRRKNTGIPCGGRSIISRCTGSATCSATTTKRKRSGAQMREKEEEILSAMNIGRDAQ